MSILIKGLEMPKSCEDCIIDHKFFKWLGCNKLHLTECLNEGTRHKDCPLIPVLPHGRLGDLDALMARLEKYHPPLDTAMRELADAPTVIQAEEGET